MKKKFIKASILFALAFGSILTFPTAASAKWDYNRGHWFYYDNNNDVATGWKNINGSWYHFSKIQTPHIFKGEMNTGWLKDDDGKWYYLYTNGAMAYNTIIDGYKLGADGAWIPDTNITTNTTNTATSTTNNNSATTVTENTYLNNQTSIKNENNTTNKKNIKSVNDLKKYLTDNYSTLETPIGTLKFTFSIHENDRSWAEYDYDISTKYGTIENDKYNLYIFSPYSLESSIKVSSKDREKTIELLKEHQRKIAKLAIDSFPDKKIQGSYYDGWYRYPNLKLDWVSRDFFSWNNYDEIDEDYRGFDDYYNTEVTDFKWTPEDDDYFN